MSLAPHFLLISPLVGFFINGVFFLSKKGERFSPYVASFFILISCLASSFLFFSIGGTYDWTYFDWLSLEGLRLPLGFQLNPVGLLLSLVVTFIGFLIHLFSIQYMSDDKGRAKYFSFLNLFIFNMLVLVLAQNLAVTFIGWEGVGLCSYLLISYWFEEEKNVLAGSKAFICNRVGDAGFLVGLFILGHHLGSLNYDSLSQSAGLYGNTEVISWAVLALFIGVTGKSAQVPLFVWLPDAMAGPSPVSALIHAATMVTAGVVVLFKLSFLLLLAPGPMVIIKYTGLITAFVGAYIALSQWDIKKILAYSTVSQLGYMVMALGLGAFSASIFHLVTHAFFKALLFLGAASLIYYSDHEQDIRKIKGSKKRLPVTYYTFLIAAAALVGVPLFSGFFSKDEILAYSLMGQRGSFVLWSIALMTAGLTAFYMAKIIIFSFWTFEGKTKESFKESFYFKVPLVLLAFFSLFIGFMGPPHFIGWNGFTAYLSSHLGEGGSTLYVEWWQEVLLIFASVLVVFCGAYAAYLFYFVKSEVSEKVVPHIQNKFFFKLSKNLFYFDFLYQKLFIHPYKIISQWSWRALDIKYIDGFINNFAKEFARLRNLNQILQNGNLNHYIFIALLFMGLFVSGRLIF